MEKNGQRDVEEMELFAHKLRWIQSLEFSTHGVFSANVQQTNLESLGSGVKNGSREFAAFEVCSDARWSGEIICWCSVLLHTSVEVLGCNVQMICCLNLMNSEVKG